MSLKVGIIGMGDGGISNLRGMATINADPLMPLIEVVAVCDTDRERLKEGFLAADRAFGVGQTVRAYLDPLDVLQQPEIELVVVATPDHEHLALARSALAAGKYVFVEKPLVTTLEDLKEIKTFVRQYPGKLLFSEKYSFAYPVQTTMPFCDELGNFMSGSTYYLMGGCDRIMAGGWRAGSAYNPCAGGLSHNFMVVSLLVGSRISRICATGRVLTYHLLSAHNGYDAMDGILEFESGRSLIWQVNLSMSEKSTVFGHRTVAHMLQFEHGFLSYGSLPKHDRLVVNGIEQPFTKEPERSGWVPYNITSLYGGMHRDLKRYVTHGVRPLHSLDTGFNVTEACILAFESAKHGGVWMTLS